MELHDDDKPVGRLLTRREMLALLGSAGAAAFAATAFKPLQFSQVGTATPEATEVLPTCVVRPERTEGPYFVDEMLNRSDIRIEPSDESIKEGIPLRLKFNVSDVSNNTCSPLEGAQIDIWNCDAVGVYSDIEEAGFNTVGQKWLRGYQLTDENGVAEFTTIYPGWYAGRTIHVHFKIRTAPGSEDDYEFTSQFFFPDDLTDEILKQEPYSEHSGERDTRNDNDMHYADVGDQLLLDLVEDDDGYSATFDIGLDLTDTETGASDSFQLQSGGGGNPGGGQPPNGTPPADGFPGNSTNTPSASATPTPA